MIHNEYIAVILCKINYFVYIIYISIEIIQTYGRCYFSNKSSIIVHLIVQ